MYATYGMYIAVLLVKAYLIAMGFNYDITHGFITILRRWFVEINFKLFQVLNPLDETKLV